MITTSDELAEILRAGGFQRGFLADVIVDGDRMLEDVPLAACEIKSDATARIRTQGTATIVYSDEIGRSVVPEDITSWLTPYATYLNISCVVSINGFTERVLLGSLKVVGVSDPQQTRVRFQDRMITVGSRISLTLADAFAVTDGERFPAPSSPTSLTSVWDEIGAISGLPMVRNVADSAITRQITYQESRLDAIFDLASILDGIPYINTSGELTLQPNVWGAETEELRVGNDGTIVAVDTDNLTDDGIYNQVVVRSYDTSQVAVLATAELTSGPLRYGGPFGRIPYFASSQFVTTHAAAQIYADSLLPTVSTVPAAQYSIQCVPDPRREVGDVIPFTKDGETLVGRIQQRSLAHAGPMTLKVAVDRG
jgi:hypothetical protein